MIVRSEDGVADSILIKRAYSEGHLPSQILQLRRVPLGVPIHGPGMSGEVVHHLDQ